MYTTTLTARFLTATAILVALASSAPAQVPNHSAMSLSRETHALAHTARMAKLLQTMDTTVLRSQHVAQRVAARLHQLPGVETTEGQGAMPAMYDGIIALTGQLGALTQQMRSMMQDEPMMANSVTQKHMEELQLELGAIAADVEKSLLALERLVAATTSVKAQR